MKSILISLCMYILLLSVPVVSTSAQSQDESYKQTLKAMLAASGAMQTSEVILTQITSMMKQSITDVPDNFWTSFAEKYKEKFHNRLTEFYTPIYQKYLTIDDLKKIIAFYESPTGKKLAQSSPAITTESMQLGQQLGAEIAAELAKELKAREIQ